MHCAAAVLGDFYSWNPSTRAWTDIHATGGAAKACQAESLNDFTCMPSSPCYLLCETGSVGRHVQSPSKYNNNEAMAWVIGVQTAKRVTLHFTNFDTEGSYDFVTVFSCTDLSCSNAVQLGRFSGAYMPADVTSSTGFMRIVWTSDYSVTYTGWTAEWTTGSDSASRSFSHKSREAAADLPAFRLNAVPAKPPARKDHGFAACQDKLYTFGGFGEAGTSPLLLWLRGIVSARTDVILSSMRQMRFSMISGAGTRHQERGRSCRKLKTPQVLGRSMASPH